MLLFKAFIFVIFFHMVLCTGPLEYISVLARKPTTEDIVSSSPTTGLLRTLMKERSVKRSKSNYLIKSGKYQILTLLFQKIF